MKHALFNSNKLALQPPGNLQTYTSWVLFSYENASTPKLQRRSSRP
jgi:hypothetical protein